MCVCVFVCVCVCEREREREEFASIQYSAQTGTDALSKPVFRLLRLRAVCCGHL